MTPNAHSLRLIARRRRRMRRAITRYAEWVVADSWKGGGDPDAIPGIEAGLRRARRDLHATVRELVRL